MISIVPKLIFIINPMNLKEIKKDMNSEIKKELKKSRLEVLTNENDFLVKNLKKAGWFTISKIFLNNEFTKLHFEDKMIFSK